MIKEEFNKQTGAIIEITKTVNWGMKAGDMELVVSEMINHYGEDSVDGDCQEDFTRAGILNWIDEYMTHEDCYEYIDNEFEILSEEITKREFPELYDSEVKEDGN